MSSCWQRSNDCCVPCAYNVHGDLLPNLTTEMVKWQNLYSVISHSSPVSPVLLFQTSSSIDDSGETVGARWSGISMNKWRRQWRWHTENFLSSKKKRRHNHTHSHTFRRLLGWLSWRWELPGIESIQSHDAVLYWATCCLYSTSEATWVTEKRFFFCLFVVVSFDFVDVFFCLFFYYRIHSIYYLTLSFAISFGLWRFPHWERERENGGRFA